MGGQESEKGREEGKKGRSTRYERIRKGNKEREREKGKEEGWELITKD